MSALHEVLAVDRDLENTAKKIVDEAITTFSKRADHFMASIKQLHMFDDARKQEEAGQEEVKALTTTVEAKLDYVAEHLVKHIDCTTEKEMTNTVASSTVHIDGKEFTCTLPATLLLAMETRLAQWRKMYEAIPTLQPGIEWEIDESQGKGVYKAKEPETKWKTEKTIKAVVLYDATDKHPAQIEKVSQDVPVGNYITTRWSGMISPAAKSELLKRIDKLTQEFKKARMRANEESTIKVELGKKIMDYINYGKV